ATFDADVITNKSDDVMTPYYHNEDEMQAATLPDSPLFEAPGGLLASVSDLANFLSAWVTKDIPLKSKSCEKMCEPAGVYKQLVDGTEYNYGCGWIRRPFGDDVLIGHGGSTGVSASYIGFLKEHGLGVAICCNTQPSNSPETLAIELLASLTDTDIVSVLPQRAIEEKVNQIIGTYTSYNNIQQAEVEWTGEYLKLNHTTPISNDQLRLMPTTLNASEYTFQTIESDGERKTVEFFLTSDEVELLMDSILLRRSEDADR
ncbi:MAG: serine hydrolase, partial [Halobacteriaceae archaeon]